MVSRILSRPAGVTRPYVTPTRSVAAITVSQFDAFIVMKMETDVSTAPLNKRPGAGIRISRAPASKTANCATQLKNPSMPCVLTSPPKASKILILNVLTGAISMPRRKTTARTSRYDLFFNMESVVFHDTLSRRGDSEGFSEKTASGITYAMARTAIATAVEHTGMIPYPNRATSLPITSIATA